MRRTTVPSAWAMTKRTTISGVPSPFMSPMAGASKPQGTSFGAVSKRRRSEPSAARSRRWPGVRGRALAEQATISGPGELASSSAMATSPPGVVR